LTSEHVDPGDDVALFIKTAAELQAFARALEKGSHTTVPLPALSNVIQRLESLTALDDFRRLAKTVAKAASSHGVKADELYAHWKLAFFERQSERAELLAHAGKITIKSVQEHIAPVSEAQAVVQRHLRELAALSPDDDDYLQTAQRHQAAAKAFQMANERFARLVGAPDTPFDPKYRYVDDWKRIVRVSEAQSGVKRRGVDPDAEAAKTLRVQQGWTQTQLIEEVQERAGIKLSVRTIRRIEAGKRVDVRTLEAIAKTLGKSLPALVLRPRC